MRKLAFGFLILSSLSSTAFASSLKTWTFNLNNGTQVKAEETALPTECSSNGKSTLRISSGSLIRDSQFLCVEDASRPDRLFGSVFDGQTGQGAYFYLYQGSEYTRVMNEIERFGTVSGLPVGNAANGKCPAQANALITLSGENIGDIPTYGYCLFPR